MTVLIDVHKGTLANNDSVQHAMNTLYATYTICVGCHGNKPHGLEKGRNGEQSGPGWTGNSITIQ